MGPHTNQAGTPARDVLDSLRRIVRSLLESSRRAEQQLGITGAQLFVLEKLAAARALSLNELAERTHTHQSSVSTVVTFHKPAVLSSANLKSPVLLSSYAMAKRSAAPGMSTGTDSTIF